SNLIKVELALFEWTGFYREGMPTWLSLRELKNAGFNIDEGYETFLQRDQLREFEPTENYYQRSYDFVRHLLETEDPSKDILLVAHGVTIDAASRQLFGKPPSSIKDMIKTITTTGIP